MRRLRTCIRRTTESACGPAGRRNSPVRIKAASGRIFRLSALADHHRLRLPLRIGRGRKCVFLESQHCVPHWAAAPSQPAWKTARNPSRLASNTRNQPQPIGHVLPLTKPTLATARHNVWRWMLTNAPSPTFPDAQTANAELKPNDDPWRTGGYRWTVNWRATNDDDEQYCFAVAL